MSIMIIGMIINISGIVLVEKLSLLTVINCALDSNVMIFGGSIYRSVKVHP
jgi:hypothetical protein